MLIVLYVCLFNNNGSKIECCILYQDLYNIIHVIGGQNLLNVYQMDIQEYTCSDHALKTLIGLCGTVFNVEILVVYC